MKALHNAQRLDHAVTFSAYQSGLPALEARLDALLEDSAPVESLVVSDPQRMLQASAEDMARVLGAFPVPARTRVLSVLDTISARPPTWFSSECRRSVLPCLTTEVTEAMSPTAVALGVTGWKVGRRITADIGLYALTHIADVVAAVRRVAQLKALAHELAHAILTPELRLSNAGLRWGDGKVTSPRVFLVNFAEYVKQFDPISRYSSAYRDSADDYLDDEEDWEVRQIAMGEELVENIVAYVLGFTVNVAGRLQFDPFTGRDATQQLIGEFLGAERVVMAVEG